RRLSRAGAHTLARQGAATHGDQRYLLSGGLGADAGRSSRRAGHQRKTPERIAQEVSRSRFTSTVMTKVIWSRAKGLISAGSSSTGRMMVISPRFATTSTKWRS